MKNEEDLRSIPAGKFFSDTLAVLTGKAIKWISRNLISLSQVQFYNIEKVFSG